MPVLTEAHEFVYIAAPYTKGNVSRNVVTALWAGKILTELGYYPFIPHLYHFWDLIHPQDYEFRMKLDQAWMTRCGRLLRLPGDSSGADAEAAQMAALGRPVYYGLRDFLTATSETVNRWPRALQGFPEDGEERLTRRLGL